LFTALAASPALAVTKHHAPAASSHAKHHAIATAPAASSHAKHHTTAAADAPVSAASSSSHGKHHARTKAAPKLRGQQGIDPARVLQIQQALIREHYLTGEATGKWDEDTKAAMQKFQADQGWQTKLMPDARALKKLGLGPDYSNAINAKNSSFVPSPAAGTTPPDQAAGFADAAGVNR
jgi:peptidoglycan hydrolase-like protein with peptidoglycan-binding domain